MRNEDEFKAWIEGFARSETSSPAFVELMVRVLSKDDGICPIYERPRMGKPKREFVRPHDESEAVVGIRHVADWLEASFASRADWTERLDGDGRHSILRVVGTLEQAVAKADKAMIRAASKTKVADTREGEEVCFERDDGWTVVRMRTPTALDYESSIMQHCIGQGAYDRQLADGRHRYYSLRDPSNKPHVTIEIDDNVIRQIKGKQNKAPADRYLALLRDFLKEQDLFVDNDSSLVLGLVRDRDQRIHNLHELPDRLRVGGNLNLEGVKIPRLPDDLEVGGYLDVCNTGIREMPKRLRTGSHLIMGRGHPTELPEDLEIGGNLDLVDSSIASLPDGLVVPGSLKLGRSDVARLPAGLKVGRDLMICASLIREIPADAEIGGRVVADGHAHEDLRPANSRAVFVDVDPATSEPRRLVRGGPIADFAVRLGLRFKGRNPVRTP